MDNANPSADWLNPRSNDINTDTPERCECCGYAYTTPWLAELVQDEAEINGRLRYITVLNLMNTCLNEECGERVIIRG